MDGANPKGLASDLLHYSLAHADGEGKLSCRWETKKRYYHVRVRELLELIYPDGNENIREATERVFLKK